MRWAIYGIIPAVMILLIPILRIPLSPFLLDCFGCHLYCTNSYRFKTASISSLTSSLEIIFIYTVTEKLLSYVDVYTAGTHRLISITCSETCVQSACDKKRSRIENVNGGPNRDR